MIDVVGPDYHYSAGEYAHGAGKTVEDIVNRGKIPLVVGGSGLYLNTLIYGISSMPEADLKFREKLQKKADEKGSIFLHERLKGVDPESAVRIHLNDLKRIIRALEIYHLTGEPISRMQRRKNRTCEYSYLIIGLNRKRDELYKRVEVRVEKMFEEGLVEEVRTLIKQGYNPELSSFQALGYKEIVDYLNRRFDFEEAKEKVKKNTRNFAKRQITYFKKNKEIKWFKLDEEKHKVLEEVERFLDSI